MAKEFGFLISSDISYGTRYLTAKLIGREDGKEYPVGISSSLDWDSKLFLDGLGLRGFISDGGSGPCEFLGANEAEYRDIYSADLRKTKAMAKTLQKIESRMLADGAREPGEAFLAMARALKLSFVVEKSPRGPQHGSSWSDSDWIWHDVPSGKNLFVHRIKELLAQANESKGIKAA